MTRFGVMKHLKVLEEASLVVTRRSGREKLHFLNPVPIRLIHDRWIDKYTERHVRRSSTSRPNWRRRHDHHNDSTVITTQVYRVLHQGHARARSGKRSPTPSGTTGTATTPARTTTSGPAAPTCVEVTPEMAAHGGPT